MPVGDHPVGLGAQLAKLPELVAQGDMKWKGVWPISGGCVHKEMLLAQ